MTHSDRISFAQIERLTHRDPGGRRLPSAERHGQFLDNGQMRQAAESLATARSVAIVTGFCTLDAHPPAAETDGPPGALYLARALLELGVRVRLITDCHAAGVLAAGCDYWRLPAEMVLEAPWQPGEVGADSPCARWCVQARDEHQWSHLLAIERPGPAHDPTSVAAASGATTADAEAFRSLAPPADWNACHNMRGLIIDEITAPLHLLFENSAAGQRPLATIGMADGGNEIGVGKLPWRQAREALADPAADKIICRVPTDWLLLAGVSNWAAYALAGAVCVLAGRRKLIAQWPVDDHGRLIEVLVREGGAVDGTTGLRQPSVDGLPLAQYLSTLDSIQRLLLH